MLGVLFSEARLGPTCPNEDFLSEWLRLEEIAAEEYWLKVALLLLFELVFNDFDDGDAAAADDNDDGAANKPLEDCALLEVKSGPSSLPTEK